MAFAYFQMHNFSTLKIVSEEPVDNKSALGYLMDCHKTGNN